MADHVIHVSEEEAASNFADVLARVRAGAEVVIESGKLPVAVLRPAEPQLRLLSESLRLAKERASTATLDGDFARDLEAAINSHREPLNPPAWDWRFTNVSMHDNDNGWPGIAEVRERSRKKSKL